MMLRRIVARFKLVSDRSGFTLIEVLVAVTILTTISGLVMTSTFQVLSVRRGWQEQVTATRDVRHAGSWFAGDALNTVTTTLADLTSDNSSTTLHWTDVTDQFHSARYYLSGGSFPYTLIREYDGNPLEMSANVESVAFSRSGKLLTFDLVVKVTESATESRSLQTHLRNMK